MIGHQGEMISRLQSESGARIQVAPGAVSLDGPYVVSCILVCRWV